MISAFAEFEREILRERVKALIEKANSNKFGQIGLKKFLIDEEKKLKYVSLQKKMDRSINILIDRFKYS
ncbi:MAG: hypothetical protein WAR79_13985 [Melioribacteraceae bacterium]